MPPTLFTIGYGSWKDTKRRMPGMLSALQDARVTMLIDIRHAPCASDPGSTGNYVAKPWNLQVDGGIASALRDVGIEYRWLVELGNPQKSDPAMSVMIRQLESGDRRWPVNRGLEMLAELVRDTNRRCCILCACDEYEKCHRHLIAETLAARHFARDLMIVDIRPKTRVQMFPA
ncbi:MAG: DUF488 domain-containing protein [Planctomycetales bacterium]|nr:DUF488 domain-containing protein [Planctomycetales bacterium]